MILFMHNRYRTTGGEERTVEDLAWLVEQQLGEQTQLLMRGSVGLPKTRAAVALLRGGERPAEIATAVRLAKARIVHAHNLHPLLGWRALAAARAAGAKVVLHLHQYRLVCAVGVCFTHGQRCTRCHGRNTLPGVLRNCRGSHAEALSYAAALALWQRRITGLIDAVIVPSAFAAQRLRELDAPLHFERVRVLAPPLRALAGRAAEAPYRNAGAEGRCAEAPPRSTGMGGGYALVASRLSPEKGVDIAIEACAAARRPLVIAGDGPERERLQRLAADSPVHFVGAVPTRELEDLRAGAALALVPSRCDETFGIAAAEAMAAGLPVLASSVGALPDLLGAEQALVPPGAPEAWASAIGRLWGDAAEGQRNRRRVAEICAPSVVASSLSAVYDEVCAA
jgi:glycosyltransferase involved in cell wall biosynthesis